MRAAESPGASATPQSRASLSLAQRQPLMVGAAEDSFPYGFVDSEGAPRGFAVDLLNAVARVMNLRLRRVVLPGRELHRRFHEGDYDLLQAFSQAPDREIYTDFTVPYLTLQGRLFVRKRGSPIRTLEDFNGRPFAISGVGSIGERFLADHRLTPRLVHVNSSEEGLRLVENGECAGVFVSQLTALSIIARTRLENVTMFGEPLADYDVRHCFAVHKGDAQLLARLNEGLAILHRTGEFDEIYQRWFGQFEPQVFTREQVTRYAAFTLAIAFLAALLGMLRQRALRRRMTRQAAQLREKEALLQALYDNIPMAMCVLEAGVSGERVLAINREAEAHFGVTAAQATGRMLAELPVNREWATHLHELVRRSPGAGAFLREERRLPVAGKHLVFTLVPLVPNEGGAARLCVLTEDVSERRELDEEIAQTRKLRAVGELVGGIAHEFNNLLTPVMLKAGEIEMDWAHDVRLLHEVGMITQAVERAAELTRRLLTFGRKGEHRPALVSLEATVTGCFALVRQTVDRRIVWEQAVPPDLPPLYLNATDLNQILLNLLINARDTLLEKLERDPAGWTPCIRVEAAMLDPRAIEAPGGGPRQPMGWQELTVRDNGLGMTAAVRERIFEPFYTTKEVGKGTGLGLATVWHLVTELGGRVEVESVPREGSTFRVLLPVFPAPEEKRANTSTGPATHNGTARVFLADDEELVADALCAALRRGGHDVVHVTNGIAAWEHLESRLSCYDVCVFDVNMPGIDGLELARRVRQAGFDGALMIASGRVGPAGIPALDCMRIDRVLAKPFTSTAFLIAIDECLHRRKPAPLEANAGREA